MIDQSNVRLPMFQELRAQPGAWAILMLIFLALLLLPFGRAFNLPLGLLAIVGLYFLVTKPRWVWGKDPLRWGLLFLLALWLPQWWSLLNAVEPEAATRTLILTPLYGLVLIAVVHAAEQIKSPAVMLYLVLAVALLWSFDGIIQFLFDANLLGYPYNGSQITGMFYPNRSLGIVLAHLLPLIFEAVRRLVLQHRGWLLLLLPIFVAIVLSGTRYAMFVSLLAIGIYTLYLFWLYRWSWRRLLGLFAGGLLVVAATLIVSEQTRERVFMIQHLTSLDREGMDQAFANRGTVWWGAWQVAKDDWQLGVGPRGYAQAVVERGYLDYSWTHPHFFGLEVLVSTGLAGLVLYLAFYLLWLRFLSRSGNGPVSVAVMLTVLLAFLPINAHWSIYASFTHGVMWTIIALGLVVLVAGRRERGQE